MDESPRPSWPIRLALAAFPRAFRDAHAAEMVEDYAEARSACETRRARVWLAVRTAVDIVASGVRERRATASRSKAQPPPNHQAQHSAGFMAMDDLIRDARYAARGLARRPAFTLIAVMTLGLGVGGTAAVYGIVRGLLFDPLPYAHWGEVGVFWKKTDWTEEEFLYIRGQTPGFRQVALYRFHDMTMREGDAPLRLLPGISASAELFDVLGVQPLLGRGFLTGDDAEGAEPVAVVSYGLWQEMGGESSIVDSWLMLDGVPRRVVGVMPRGFWFPDPSVRVWTPEPLDLQPQSWNSTLIGRVAPGHDVRTMAAPVARLAAMLDERFDYAEQWDKTRDAQITPLRDDIVGGMRPALLATLGAMALVLLIACANVAALMLGQVAARSSELAVRLALGANRLRLMQQLVVETLLVAVAAGALGAGLAWGGLPVLARALPLGAWTETIVPDWTVFASAMAIAVVAALLVVLVPTWSLWRGKLREALGRSRTGTLEGRSGRLENGLVVAEVALAVLIAAGAALLARSLTNLYALDPGVRTEGVGIMDIMVGGDSGGGGPKQVIDRLTAAIAAQPGVRSAATTQTLPLRGGGYRLPISIQGYPDTEDMVTEYRMVTPGYLETMGIALREGRSITEADRGDAERVVVINEALAEKYFPGLDPIGQRVGGDIGSFARVVGVVANVAERHLTDDAVPVRYVPLAQMPWVDESQSLVFHTASGVDPVELLEAVRQTVERVAPGVPVRAATTMSRELDTAVGPARQVLSLLALLTGLALTLGAVGVYGVMAHFAARHQRDWAIRMALGLSAPRAVRQLVGRSVILVAAGIVLGVVAAASLTRLLSSFLYGVQAVDLIAFAAAGAAALGVGVLAAFIPARRAGMTDPAVVLREQ